MLKKFANLSGWVILSCLGSVQQIRGCIPKRYFWLFGLSLTNSWIYSDALFWVGWVVSNKFVDLFECVILGCLGCLGCVEQNRVSIVMPSFGLFGLF